MSLYENSALAHDEFCSQHAMLLISGELYGVGNNDHWQLGFATDNGLHHNLTHIPQHNRYKQVATGYLHHTLAVTEDGKLWGWGHNHHCQAGTFPRWYHHQDPANENARPTQIDESDTIYTDVAAGRNFSIALDNRGNVYSFGANYNGQLGHNEYRGGKSICKISSLKKITQIVAGASHVVALDTKGALWAWGSNKYGQLGMGLFSSVMHTIGINDDKRSFPCPVSKLKNIKFIAAGGSHTLALSDSGQLWGFGSNVKGQLGLGKKRSVFVPEKIPIEEIIEKMWCVRYSSLAKDSHECVWVFGSNTHGELALGDNKTRRTPIENPNLRSTTNFVGGHSLLFAIRHDELYYFSTSGVLEPVEGIRFDNAISVVKSANKLAESSEF